MSPTTRFLPRLTLAMAFGLIASQVEAAEPLSGLVDIGSGRKMYVECSGTGSPTVILISGKGNGAADWSEVLGATDPVHNADYDALAWGNGDQHKSETAVFPMVSRFTRVCAYDRPGVRLDGPDQSTSIAQPHLADQAADDLRRCSPRASPAPMCLSHIRTGVRSPSSLREPGPARWTASSWSTQ